MICLSQAVSRIGSSATSVMTDTARKLRAQGVDIISLSVGEPDFPTPDHIVEAAAIAMGNGIVKYTTVDGTPALKSAISAKFLRENGIDYTSSQISVNCGGKHTIFNALMATLDPGDEVIIPAPYWVSYPEIVRFAGASPIILSTGIAAKYKLSPDALAAAITPRSKWLILNSPGNPTGAVYTRAELDALGEILAPHPRIMVLSDDIYEHIRYTVAPYATMAAVRPDLKDRVLTMNGVSKAYAMTGWRIGYAGGPEWLISAMARLQSQSTSNPATISQAAAVEALNGVQDFLKDRARAFRERRDVVVPALDAMEGVTCAMPDGAFYAFAEADGLIGRRTAGGLRIENDTDLAGYFLEHAHVAVVPGSAFGQGPAFRVSYAADMDTLQNAMRRLARAVAELD